MSCPAGTSSENAGRFDVTQCLADAVFTKTAADGAPLASVRPCDAGTYKPDVGDHACAPCPAHRASAPGATSLEACFCVAPAYHEVDGSCGCAPGFLYSSASTTCVPCPAGSFCLGTLPPPPPIGGRHHPPPLSGGGH